MKVEIKNLDFELNQNKILNDINLTLEGNKVIGILGPNGAGKTSLLKHIYREVHSVNKIFIDGVDISKYDSKEFFQKVSILTQFQKEIDTNLMVEDVLLMGRYPYKTLLSKYDELDYRLVDEAIDTLNLSHLRHRFIKSLSGGEFQRVMMAKVLVTHPELIILDEPTNHLDIKYKVELMEILRDIEALTLVSLHDLELATKFCDEIILLKDGALVKQGEPKEILTEELLSNTFDIKYKIIKEPEFIIYY